MTEEKALPVLDAAHIRPFSERPRHDVRNGLLLRTDIHRPFDVGYVTVTPGLRMEAASGRVGRITVRVRKTRPDWLGGAPLPA